MHSCSPRSPSSAALRLLLTVRYGSRSSTRAQCCCWTPSLTSQRCVNLRPPTPADRTLTRVIPSRSPPKLGTPHLVLCYCFEVITSHTDREISTRVIKWKWRHHSTCDAEAPLHASATMSSLPVVPLATKTVTTEAFLTCQGVAAGHLAAEAWQRTSGKGQAVQLCTAVVRL